MDKEVKSENFFEEYGYGFLVRFLTVHQKDVYQVRMKLGTLFPDWHLWMIIWMIED